MDAYAWPPTFGPEFTFIPSDAMTLDSRGGRDPESEAYRQVMQAHTRALAYFERLCGSRGDCSVDSRPYRQKYVISFPARGIDITVGIDGPAIEVNVSPLTLEQATAAEPLLQEMIWGTMAQHGLIVDPVLAGGHMHGGFESAFDGDVVHFRNAVVDWANHPEVFSGIFAGDYNNARPIAGIPEIESRFRRAIKKLDQRIALAARGGPAITVGEARKLINVGTYGSYETDDPLHFSNRGEQNKFRTFQKYSQINLAHLDTFELRGFAPQKSFAEWLLQCRLIQARLAWVKNGGGKIPIRIPAYYRAAPVKEGQLFRAWVEESGLDWNDYRGLLESPQLQTLVDQAPRIPSRSANGCTPEALSLNRVIQILRVAVGH